ncbi:MAG: hypothetical protein BGO87_07430 [Flavobacteriia bacterium 40-80]|uniref:hypothetical protein n=1 Tax=uncultured Flavobacterium sp. TaxID=165435 RepID=UPI000969763F|nr:hypothetical protein [uncultured Flavobacterium sp.]OJX36277.1 MAG: hypothetical protein BGO87_07430 [Flavobacteriia bacterium 40-80]HRP37017.1 hypothetical protein [Candidatus Dojkabacteria bacterium]
MKALEKAKLALREHLLNNRDRVLSDLEEMRKKSEGNDIFNYVENLSESFSWSDVSTCKEVVYDYSFPDIDYYNVIDQVIDNLLYSPPGNRNDKNRKKDPEILSGSFFLLILRYVRSTKSSIFI